MFYIDFSYVIALMDVKPFHQSPVLLRGQRPCLGCTSGPLESAILKMFIHKEKSISFPKKTFDSVSSSSAEEEQHIFFKGIKDKLLLYYVCQTVYAESEISISAYQIHSI